MTFPSQSPSVLTPVCRVLPIVLVLTGSPFGRAQTNTFPASGNVGIGTTQPTAPLTISQGYGSPLISLQSTTGPAATRPATLSLADATPSQPGTNLGINSDRVIFGSAQQSTVVQFYTPAIEYPNGMKWWMGNTSLYIGAANDMCIQEQVNNINLFKGGYGEDTFINSDSSHNVLINAGTGTSTGSAGIGFAGSNGTGNVGIGTATPDQKLQLANDSYIGIAGQGGTSLASADWARPTGGGGYPYPHGGIIFGSGGFGTRVVNVAYSNGYGLSFDVKYTGHSWINDVLVISGRMTPGGPEGYVGIGTNSPQYPLSVAGTIQAQEVLVQTGWSDYVFAKDYRLTPLRTVEAQIRSQGHLPGIPSAREVGAKGVSVGEMEARLLAKVEELTLHAIDQEKRLEQLERENRELQRRLDGTD